MHNVNIMLVLLLVAGVPDKIQTLIFFIIMQDNLIFLIYIANCLQNVLFHYDVLSLVTPFLPRI